MTGPVRTELQEDGRVLRVWLSQPKGNVLNQAMMAALGGALREHAAIPHLKLVVLQGDGGHFSFGAAVEEHQKDQAPGMLRAFHALCRQVAGYPVPVAAMVEGRCLGGAFELVLCCHVMFAAPDAVMGCPEIKLGVFPPVLAALGAQRLGSALAERLILTGEGVNRDALGPAVVAVAGVEDVLAWYRKNLAPLSAVAVRNTAHVYRQASGFMAALGAPLDLAEKMYLERVLTSHDGNEGIRAFMEKRPARWEDR